MHLSAAYCHLCQEQIRRNTGIAFSRWSPIMHRTLPLLLSKRITIPRLSPSHTQVRILRYETNIANGRDIASYDPIMIVECSPDLVTAGLREFPDERIKMLIDTQDEGVVRSLRALEDTEWLAVGTHIGVIDDGDPIDGDWTWQAYLHTE